MTEIADSIRDIDHVGDLLDRLYLDHDARRHGALVVEGESDARILSQALSSKELSFFPLAGRSNVLDAADRLGVRLLPGVVCVVDTDFDFESEKRAHESYVVFTDNADIETMLFFSPALDRVLLEWASREKLQRFGGSVRLRSVVLDLVAVVSRLRSASFQCSLDLTFDAFKLDDVISKRELSFNLDGFLNRVASASAVSRQDINAAIADVPIPMCPYTATPLARGRDCCEVVGISLRQAIGSLSKQQIAGRLVEKSMRLSVLPSDLQNTPFLVRLDKALSQALA